VAVTLYETENFITDLPFLECVLPSMQAGEPYFVPAFIQKILLPYWEHGGGYFREYEKFILNLTRDHFLPAMSEYLELLFLAAVLEQPLDAACTVVLGRKVTALMALIRELLGVGPPSEFLRGSEAIEKLKMRLVKNLRRIPAMLMIGHQWKFDVKMMAINIMRIANMDSGWMQAKQLQYDLGVDRLLGDIIDGIQLPNLSFISVSWIAWTMNPDFIWDFDKGMGVQVLRAKVRFDSVGGKIRGASQSRTRRRKASMRDILRELEIREMNRKPEYVPFLPITKEESTKLPVLPVKVGLTDGPRQTILSVSDAPHTLSLPAFQEPPLDSKNPEMPTSLDTNLNPLKLDCEPPISPVSCLSEFPDDPLDLFGPNILKVGPFGDDDPFGLHGPLDPIDFIYNGHFDDE
jgi:hypothetical protein